MNYFDTDVIIHSIVNQDLNRHLKANDLIEESVKSGIFLISLLTIQETGFVLAKLSQPPAFIVTKLNALLAVSPVEYGLAEFTRAM